jgi:hypothetical protein
MYKYVDRSLDPLTGLFENLEQSLLSRSLRGSVVVHPRRSKRKRHENGFDASRRSLQTERGSSIVDKVELDVSTSSELLPLLLLGSVREILSSLDDGHVRGQERSKRRPDETKELLGILVLEIIEEDTSDTSGLLSVLNDEVLITPLLKLPVVVLVVLVASFLESLVEVNSVLLKQVRGGKIASSTEPPSLGGTIGVHGFKVSIVEVDSRSHGVDWVENHRQTTGIKGEVSIVGRSNTLVISLHLLDSHGGQQAVNNRYVNTGLLKHLTILQNTRNSSSSLAIEPTLPLINSEGGGVIKSLKLGHDLLLHLLDEVLHSELDGSLIVTKVELVKLGELGHSSGLDSIVANRLRSLELSDQLGKILSELGLLHVKREGHS